jgi:hypothetical protein
MFVHRMLLDPSNADPARWGASLAQADIRPLVVRFADSRHPDSVVMDFRGIKAINASYARASVAWFLRCISASRRGSEAFTGNIDPWAIRPLQIKTFFVSNLSDDVREEIDGLLRQPSFKLACFELQSPVKADDRPPGMARLLGHLDQQLYQCLLRLYGAGGKATATDLQASFPGDGVQTTAWNNRLASLYERGLVARIKDGRSWIYHTITEDLNNYGIPMEAA